MQFSITSNAQIDIPQLPLDTACTGTTLDLLFIAQGTFDPSNEFVASLSDTNGFFNNPAIVGSVQATTSTFVSVTIPIGTPPGHGYRLRVDGTMPFTPGISSANTMTIVAAPNAGINSQLSICSSSAPVAWIGAPPGIWYGPNGQPFLGPFEPAVDPPGVYTNVHPGSAPCVPDTMLVTMVVNAAPNAGTSATFSISSTSAPAMLISQLGGAPQPGGFWTSPNGNAMSGIFNPSIDPPGCYAYTVAGIAPCLNASATVCVVVIPGTIGVTPVSNFPDQ